MRQQYKTTIKIPIAWSSRGCGGSGSGGSSGSFLVDHVRGGNPKKNKPESRSTIKAGNPAMKLRKNIHKTCGILNIQITFEIKQFINSFSTSQLPLSFSRILRTAFISCSRFFDDFIHEGKRLAKLRLIFGIRSRRAEEIYPSRKSRCCLLYTQSSWLQQLVLSQSW